MGLSGDLINTHLGKTKTQLFSIKIRSTIVLVGLFGNQTKNHLLSKIKISLHPIFCALIFLFLVAKVISAGTYMYSIEYYIG